MNDDLFGSDEIDDVLKGDNQKSVHRVNITDDAASLLFNNPNNDGSHKQSRASTRYNVDDLMGSLSGSSAILNKDYDKTKIQDLSNRLDKHGLFGSDTSMFKDDDASRNSKVQVKTTSIKNMTFDEFLDVLSKSPDNKPINDAIKKFILSTTGPNGDGSPPDISNQQVNKLAYEFRGGEDLAKRYSQFTEDLINYMGTLTKWKAIVDDEDELMTVQCHLEAYIVGFIADIAFRSVQNSEEDDRLYRRMKVLSTFIEPEVRN